MNKKILQLFMALAVPAFGSPAFASGESVVKDYLVSTTQLVQKHILLLDAAENAAQAADVLRKYATAMKPVMKKSEALKKKYPKALSGETVKTDMEAMFNTMQTMNEKIGQARQKYGEDKKFQAGEKALKKAGLYGTNR